MTKVKATPPVKSRTRTKSTNKGDRKQKDIPTITDPKELFALLYRRAEAEGPFIAVDQFLSDGVREVFRTIQDEQYFDIAPFLWPDLLRHIQWDKQDDKTAPRCSLGVLIFVGHMQQVVMRNMGTTIPLALAIEVLIRLCKLEDSFEGWHMQSRSWIRTTRTGAETLGFSFDKKMRRCAEDHDFWDWYGHVGDT